MKRIQRGWHAFIERILPWYDRDAEQERAAHSAELLEDAKVVEGWFGRLRGDYTVMDRRIRIRPK